MCFLIVLFINVGYLISIYRFIIMDRIRDVLGNIRELENGAFIFKDFIFYLER